MQTYKRVALYCSRAHTRLTVWRLVQCIFEGDKGAVEESRWRCAGPGPRPAERSATSLSSCWWRWRTRSTSTHPTALSRCPIAALGRPPPPRASDSTAAALDLLACVLHIGAVGLCHPLPFIRHHSALLLINVIHATAFKSQHQAARVMFVPSRLTGGGCGPSSNPGLWSVDTADEGREVAHL